MPDKKGNPINVSLRVIADLSQGLYRSPADALKELVSNAYDADSPKVEINFAKDFSSLTIRDWGKGMTIDDFIETMETIGGSSKRSAGVDDVTPSGRKIVGRIGIGLLGVSQIASFLEIESTVKGSSIGFRAQIEFDQFASEEARKLKITDILEKDLPIEIGKYYYTEIRGVNSEDHFTTLRLTRLRRTFVQKLTERCEKDGYERMLGKTMYSLTKLVKWMGDNGVTKTGLHEYDRLFFEICTLCPISYLHEPLKIYKKTDKSSSTNEFVQFTEKINKETHLKLTFDGIECFKPILMPSKIEREYSLFFNLLFMKGINGEIVHYRDYDKTGKLVERKISVRGYFYFQRPKVWPPELQGLLIRVRHVAIGQYDSTFMTYRRHEGFKFSQITGEILVDELDEALNIDRSSFRETDPSFIALRNFIHGYLGGTVFPEIKSFASEDRISRKEEWDYQEEKDLQKSFKLVDTRKRKVVIGDNASKIVERSESEISLASKIDGKKQKFSSEFYRIVAFLEAYLINKMNAEERDKLYQNLSDWMKKFE